MARRGRIANLLLLGLALAGLAVWLLHHQQPRPPIALVWVVRGAGLLGQWALFLAIVSPAVAGRLPRAFGRTFRTVHYALSVAGLALMLAHALAVALVLGQARVLLPVAPSWRGLLEAGGRPALYLLVALAVLPLWRRARRWWRPVHLLAYPAFGLVTAHALLIGRTHHNPWLRAATLAMAALALATLVWLRVRARRRRAQR